MFNSYLCKVLLLSFVISLCQPIKVNMQGSVSLGREVVDTLTDYVRKNYISSSQSNNFIKETRRKGIVPRADFISPSVTNTISVIIKSETICSDINFCQDSAGDFVDRYLFALTEVIERIFEDLIHDKSQSSDTVPKIFIFEGGLKKLLKEVKKILIKANDKIQEETDIVVWIGLLKKLSVLYQEKAMVFCSKRLEGTADEIVVVEKRLREKLIVATAYVELDFERKLCLELKMCLKKYYCTKSLHTLLEIALKLSSDKLKEFIRDVYESLADTNFYSYLNEATANEFQFILHHMAYSDNIASKNVFNTVKESVGNRLETITTSKDKHVGKDVKLMHIILSDMDYFYSKHKYDPFDEFTMELEHWSTTSGKFKNSIRKIIKDITNELASNRDRAPEIVDKLINEVKIFMDLTVEPGGAS